MDAVHAILVIVIITAIAVVVVFAASCELMFL